MSLPHAPDRGSIIIVNFELGGGGVGDEMCKPMRPCIVVQNNKLHRSRLVTIVPISTTEPEEVRRWHHQLSHLSFRGWPIDWDGQGTPRWAICDYVTTVSLDRCVHPYRKRPYGVREYTRVKITRTDLEAVEAGVRYALGIAVASPEEPKGADQEDQQQQDETGQERQRPPEGGL